MSLSLHEMARLLQAKESDKDSKFEEGEDVSLSELPEELQDNVKNPPPSVEKLKKKMKEGSEAPRRVRLTARHQKGVKVDRRDLPPAFVEQIDSEKFRAQTKGPAKAKESDDATTRVARFRKDVRSFAKAARNLRASLRAVNAAYQDSGDVELEKMIFDTPYPFKEGIGKVASSIQAWETSINKGAKAESDKDSKFEEGEDVSLSELPEELQDNVKNPPPSVKKLKEKMKD